MNRVLVRVIAHLAVFLEFADEATLDPDVAVKQIEDLAFQLQQLAPTERREFMHLLNEVAGEWAREPERDYLRSLPEAMGIA